MLEFKTFKSLTITSLLSTPSKPASLALIAAFLNCSTIVLGSSTAVG